MNTVDICRVCLCGDRRMNAISNTVLQEMWEMLTKAEFNNNDGKSLLVCYICYALLRKSHQLMKRASKADELLTAFINSDLKQSLNTISLIASLTEDFDYVYGANLLYTDSSIYSKQCDENSVEEIKLENEGRSEENNEEENNINIKEENNINIKEEEKDSCQEVNVDIADAESSTHSEDYAPLQCISLKNILKRDVCIVLERIDTGAPAEKRELNDAPRDAKRINVYEDTNKKLHSNNSISDTLPNNNCKALDTSFCKKNSVRPNLEVTPNKETIQSIDKSDQVSNISPQVNTLSKDNIETKNVILQNNETYTSKVCNSTTENEIFQQCLPNNAVAPLTSLDKSNEGNELNISNKKGLQNEFSCQIYQYKCVRKIDLNEHLRKHTGEKQYICDLCDYRCSRKSLLESHMMYKHIKERRFSCHLCQYKCVTKSNLNIHVLKHTAGKPYICDSCDYRYKRKDTLKYHIKCKHIKAMKFSCHICDYKCVTKDDLDRHVLKHTGEKPYICDQCDYRCSQKPQLHSHVMHKHTKEKRFSCPLCQYKFVTKSNLNRHILKHTGEKQYICDLCDYRCSRKCLLDSHMMYKHIKERRFSCHLCQYKCVIKSNLNIHVLKHTGEKRYICDSCDYRCSYKGNLKNHIKRKHIKAMKFSCHICDYKCVGRNYLNRHVRKHTGEKPYICDSCDYRCSRKENLKNHIECKHIKAMKFSCHICDYKCVRKDYLKKHVRKHTGDKLYTE